MIVILIPNSHWLILKISTYHSPINQDRAEEQATTFEANYLHLNKAKGSWTCLADIYGVVLCLLALTGLLMIRGKQKQHGIILTAMGFLVPLIYLLTAP